MIVCQGIYREVFEYYYSSNTFLLDLTDPKHAPNKFVNGTRDVLKYLGHVKSLRLVIGDSIYSNHGPCALSEYAQERIEWFLKTVGKANENHQGLWLKKLVILDHFETSFPEKIPIESFERGEKRREVLISLFGPFTSKIGNIKIESRALSKPITYYVLLDTSTGIVTN